MINKTAHKYLCDPCISWLMGCYDFVRNAAELAEALGKGAAIHRTARSGIAVIYLSLL
jgi:hypothetical protein